MFASLILLASLVSVVSAVGPHKTHHKLSSEEVSKFMDLHGERLIDAKIAKSSFSGMQAQIRKTHGKKSHDLLLRNEKVVSMGVAPLQHRPDMKKQRRAHATHSHKVVFAVKQKNLDRLEQILHEVSDPKSKKFGRHLTRAQVTELTANPEATESIVQYLARNGASVVSQTKGGEYITAEAPVHVWESLFQTTFYEFEQEQNSDKKVVRAEEFFAPASLPELVSYVYNVIDFPEDVETSAKDLAKIVRTEGKKLRKAGKKNSAASIVNGVIIEGDVTPAFINQLYLIPSNTGSQLASQAVYESLNQSYSPSDLTDFQNAFQLPVETVTTVIGGHAYDNACVPNDGNDCGEANLDVQYLMGISQNTPTTYYYDEDWMLGFIKSVADMANPPLVFSISYGGSETSPEYTSSFDTEAMKLGVMGVTILASSGDDGVAGAAARGRPYLCRYSPSFPASSPYVTAVGGTFGPESGKPEVACTSDEGGVITTGGGFSNRYPQPSWQTAQVNAYFQTVAGTSQAPAAGYNPTGRGYPDVSALAARYVIYSNGEPSPIWGTSASAPTVSAMVSLVNSARLDAGKSALGWINPSLYALQDEIVLNDITSGENNCVAVATVCCTQGFYATKGWDPVTGIGSLNFTAFKNAFYALGDSPNSPTAQPTPLPGSPTLAPVVSPTLAPSTQPSAQPTLSSGWLTYTVYGKTGCTSTSNNPAVLVTGVPSGQCFASYNISNPSQVVGSERYSCAGSLFANIERYSDAACSPDAFIGSTSLSLGCTPTYQSNYDTNVYLSAALTCTAATVSADNLPLPAASTESVYSTHLSYSSDGTATDGSACVATELSGFSSFLNGVCFSDAYQGVEFSLLYQYPNVLEYRAAACQSKDFQLTRIQSESCVQTLHSDDDSIFVAFSPAAEGDVRADADDTSYGSSYYASIPGSTSRTYGYVQKSTVAAASSGSSNGFFDKTTNVIAIAVTAGVVGLALVGVLAYWLIFRNSSTLKKPLLEGSQV